MSKVPKVEPSTTQGLQEVPGRRVQKSRLALAALCLYWPAIFLISHIPKSHVPKNVQISGITVHLGAYFLLTLLVFLNAGLLRSTSLRSKKTWLLAGLIAVYAALDELLQCFVEGRDGSLNDWTIDMAACLFCIVLLAIVASTRQYHRSTDSD